MAMSSKTLDLVLLVSATFFVVADIVLALCLGLVLPRHLTRFYWYPAYGEKISFTEAAEKCPCLYNLFPNGTKKLITLSKMPNPLPLPIKDKERDPYEKLQFVPFLVAVILMNITEENRVFGCSGLIANETTFIAGMGCTYYSGRSFIEMYVRSGSPFWKFNGVEHKIMKAFNIGKDKDYVYCVVRPPFNEELLPKTNISFDFEGDWEHAVSLGWDDTNMDSDFDNRPFVMERWTYDKEIENEYSRCSSYSTKNTTRIFMTTCNSIFMAHWNEVEICQKFGAVKEDIDPYDNFEKCNISKKFMKLWK